MITDMAKMVTGLVVRGGLGLPLRIAAFATMTWGAWHAWLACGVPYLAWAEEHYAHGLLVLSLFPVVVAIIITFFVACDHTSRRNRCRDPWKHWDFVRRAPFAVWCLITDDGRDVPVWAIVSWPAVAVVDFAVAIITLVILPLRGLWIILEALGRVIWRGLDYRPLDR